VSCGSRLGDWKTTPRDDRTAAGASTTSHPQTRALPPLVEARAGDTDVRIDDWSLTREEHARLAQMREWQRQD
jgi:hypothetical protein